MKDEVQTCDRKKIVTSRYDISVVWSRGVYATRWDRAGRCTRRGRDYWEDDQLTRHRTLRDCAAKLCRKAVEKGA